MTRLAPPPAASTSGGADVADAPPVVRGYMAVRAAWRVAATAIDAGISGLALGVMSPGDLRRLDELYYHRSLAYRTDQYNRRGLFPWEAAIVAEHFPPPAGRLLVVGAGGGREVLALTRLGYAVDGYECNVELVAFAGPFLAREGCAGTVRWIEPDTAPTAAGAYDGVLTGWTMYTLIPGRERRIRFLRQLRAAARPGAPIVLSFFPRASDDRRSRVVGGIAGAVRRVLRRPTLERGDDLAPNFVHRFTEVEVAAELDAAELALRTYEPGIMGVRECGIAIAASAPPPSFQLTR